MSKMDFVQMERDVLDFWQREECFRRLVEKNKGKPKWSFLDGPITANNPMGVHHAWGRSYKDIFQRYHAMMGRELRYQNGFDCQGLWVEVEVEKELGFKSKRDIESYGIDKFVEKCKERVRKFAAVQSQQSIRLGYWMDWDNSYYTMTDTNNYTIWQFLQRCHKRGYIYHGFDSMPWCPRCGTGISQHEISNEERPEVVHTSPTVRFPLLGRPGEYLLIWTTTPWTLTSNVAAAVHPERTYVKVRQNGEIYYLIKERMEPVMGHIGPCEVLGELPGAQMLGWTYSGPFDELPAQTGVGHRVIPWTEVSSEDGTGIVHIAPGCGKEDYELGLEHKIPAIAPIDESGIFLEKFGPYTGQFAHDVTKPILRSLKEKGILYRTEEYRHAYPICWRCKTQLLFRLVDEWYISMDELRHKIMDVTKKTRWIPEIGLQQELEWLTNMHDWMISKKRYWGLALPIYLCRECNRFEVIGGHEELQKRAVEGWEKFDGHSPHRPWVDEVKIACPQCGKATSRVPDVGNPWLDAGIVPYSTMRYDSDREYWRQWFPADWISESFPGQFRNWFYAILAMSTVMEEEPPFRLMFGYRLMKDEKGQEMHKSKGNAVEFNQAAEQEGADPMRWLFAAHYPEHDLWFGLNKVHEARRQFLVFWNVFEFYQTYAQIDGFEPRTPFLPLDRRSELDRWILCRLEMLIRSAHTHYPAYAIHLFMRDVLSFIDALSRWYLRRSRRRFWKSRNDDDKLAAYQTLWQCLQTTAQLLAPVIPFSTEHIYQQIVRRLAPEAPVSVHHTDFPKAGSLAVDEELLEGMDSVLELVELGHAARNKAQIKVRQPLPLLRLKVADAVRAQHMQPYLDLVREELNVKQIELTESVEGTFQVSVRLDAKTGKPKYGRLFAAVEDALKKMDPLEVEKALKSGKSITLTADQQTFHLTPEEILVEKKATDGWAMAEGSGMTVLLSVELTPELQREGAVRDLVRHVQNLRKKIGLEVTDRILLEYTAADAMALAVEHHANYLAEETLAVEIARKAQASPNAQRISLGGENIDLNITKA